MPKAIIMTWNGNARLHSLDRKPCRICFLKSMMDSFRFSIKVRWIFIFFRFLNSLWIHLDLPAPCKVFPKTPKIALTIDDIPQQQSSEFIRRKSSGSSVNSNTSTIEPHIYEFQENEKHAESSLVLRLVWEIFTFYLHILG